MNKAQLIDSVAERLPSKKIASEALEAFVDVITEAVAKGEKISINGFGSFERVTRAERSFYNPATGEHVHVPATNVPKFKVGAGFRAAVNGHA
jgi:DNA-binding protein HU-beta